MKKLTTALLAAALSVIFTMPVFASTANPLTGDMTPWVIGALVVAACAIIGTLIFTWKRK